MRPIIVACLVLLFAGEALADDGFFRGSLTCTGTASTGTVSIGPGEHAVWCPVSTTSLRIRVRHFAHFVYNGDTSGTGAGTATLSVKSCGSTGANANACKASLVDRDDNDWVVASNTKTQEFSLPAGEWLIEASAAEANGMLSITGY